MDIRAIGAAAKAASRIIGTSSNETRNAALRAIAAALEERKAEIFAANEADLAAARENGMSAAMLDRLALNESRVKLMAQGALELLGVPDPLDRVFDERVRPNGLKITKKAVPLGVIAIIYEARPNVTVDAAVLCLKSGNAVILKGGKEAINSNLKLGEIMRAALESAGLPADCVTVLPDTSREAATALMTLNEFVDVLIPRGGAGLISAVVKNATVPTIETGTGNCHAFVDASADLDMAADIIFNAKTSRPSVCNALETALVHADVAEKFLPLMKSKLDEKNVELRGCERARAILGGCVKPAVESDWANEFLDYILAVKVVGGIDEALAHIARYSTGHSEAIITENAENAARFLREVDAAAVYVNASTRFTDGGEFGYGAEIGISTQKLHARGPMGVDCLTTYKYLIEGDGQVR
ncbi:MAG: glutamate-5-semialdehyde dehydrogenase [Clostridia bacterium]|nr:glutamate-5-semialdehyde dehydrogenase [Clostridia bacterium]MBQ9557333.1 glutamate-5-semialdehyde dehydrogenase [Clostridia bacterium]